MVLLIHDHIINPDHLKSISLSC